jgi:hypothetical protein
MSTSYTSSSGSVAGETATSRSPGRVSLCEPVRLTSQEKTAAIARVRWLEREVFEDGQVRRRVSRHTAEVAVEEINQLRAALGWLEIDLEGRWRWPH